MCVLAAGRCTLQRLPCEQGEVCSRRPAALPGASVRAQTSSPHLPAPSALIALLLQESPAAEAFIPRCSQRFEFCTVSQPPLPPPAPSLPAVCPASRRSGDAGGRPAGGPVTGRGSPRRVWGKKQEPDVRFPLLPGLLFAGSRPAEAPKRGKFSCPNSALRLAPCCREEEDEFGFVCCFFFFPSSS